MKRWASAFLVPMLLGASVTLPAVARCRATGLRMPAACACAPCPDREASAGVSRPSCCRYDVARSAGSAVTRSERFAPRAPQAVALPARIVRLDGPAIATPLDVLARASQAPPRRYLLNSSLLL